MRLTPRNRVILVAAVTALVVVVLAVLLVVPQVQELGSLDAQMAAANQDARNAQLLLEQRFEVRNRAAATDAKLMQLATAFPENPELPSAIIELQDLAYESDVELQAVTPEQQLVPRGNHIAIPITLRFLGDWRSAVDFLEQLVTLNRQYRVVDASVVKADEISAAEKGFGPYSVVVTSRIEAYVIPASDATATAPAVPAAPAP